MKSFSDELDISASGLENNSVHECEERLRVDRRKLEQMLQLAGTDYKEIETADTFFQRIMKETDTQIYWPSQLKVGAKSKKDPHIKICGKSEAVYKAKEKIMEVLDTKRNRVTMKMDVSYTDHSHVIGKGGHNVQRIMEETGCHIHFPDSNRTSQAEKSNQVSITGEPVGVEKARNMIRELLPVVITFELPLTGFLQPVPDSSTPDLQLIQYAFGFVVSFRQRTKGGPTHVIVRCSQEQFGRHKQGILLLMEHLTGNKMTELPVSINVEILPPHQTYVMGRAAVNIHLIMQRTGATITFPGTTSSCTNNLEHKKTTVVISGSIDSVFIAWQELMNCLPLMLIFDLKEGQDFDTSQANYFLKKHNVISITIRPKPKFNTKTVTLRGAERDSKLLIELRQQLLGLEKIIFPPDKNDLNLATSLLTYPLDRSFQSLISNSLDSLQSSASTSESLGALNSIGNQYLPTTCPSPLSQPITSEENPLLLQLLNKLPNTSTTGVSEHLQQVSAVYSNSHLNPLSENNQHQTSSKFYDRSSPSLENSRAQTSRLWQLSGPSSPNSEKSCKCSSCGQEVIHQPVLKPSVREYHRWLSPAPSPSISRRLSVPQEQSYYDLNNSPSSTGGLSSSQSCRESFGNVTLNDLKKDVGTVGCERKNGLQKLLTPTDYEYKKVLATKAMQRSIDSEAQVPSNMWAGYGFSRSMPASLIKQRLHESGLSCHNSYIQRSDEETSTSSESSQDDWSSSKLNSDLSFLEGNPLLSCRGESLFSNSNFFEAVFPKPPLPFNPDTEELPPLLCRQGLAKYVDTFLQQEVDLQTFLMMTDQDLQDLGIGYGARRKMLWIISEIKQKFSTHLQEFKPFDAAPGAERDVLLSRMSHHRPSNQLLLTLSSVK